jgi:hypothetical protein
MQEVGHQKQALQALHGAIAEKARMRVSKGTDLFIKGDRFIWGVYVNRNMHEDK